jgi:ankyrin repeat protein
MSLSLRRPSKNNGKPTTTQLEKILEDNDIEAMREYLEKGGDPNIPLQGGDKLTPLAKAETAEMAKLLLKHNADVHAKMDRGKTALLWQVLHPKPEVVKVLLEAHPSIINDKDEVGDTALHYAALHSYK